MTEAMQKYAWKTAFMRGDPGVLTEYRKVDFRAVKYAVSRSVRDCFFPVGIQVIFETYRWMVSSAAECHRKWSDRDANWRRYPGVLDAIGHAGSSVGHRYPEPFSFNWKADMAERMLRALTYNGCVEQWRKEQKIDPEGWRRLRVLAYRNPLDDLGQGGGEAQVEKALDALFALDSEERRVIPQLNPCHRDARRVTGIRLHAGAEGWIVVLHYGFDGSSWEGPDVEQRKNEPFYDFIVRARRSLEKILTPACNPRRSPTNRRVICAAGITTEEQVAARAARLSLALGPLGDGFSPGMFSPDALPVEIELEDDGTYSAVFDEYGQKYHIGYCGYRHRRPVSEQDVRMARARYLLKIEAIRRSYGEILMARGEHKADRYLAPGPRIVPGSAIREQEEALRYQREVRPVVFFPEPSCGADEWMCCEP